MKRIRGPRGALHVSGTVEPEAARVLKGEAASLWWKLHCPEAQQKPAYYAHHDWCLLCSRRVSHSGPHALWRDDMLLIWEGLCYPKGNGRLQKVGWPS